MTKTTINDACKSLLIIIEENKKLLSLAKAMELNDKVEDRDKILEVVYSNNKLINELSDYPNRKSLTIA